MLVSVWLDHEKRWIAMGWAYLLELVLSESSGKPVNHNPRDATPKVDNLVIRRTELITCP